MDMNADRTSAGTPLREMNRRLGREREGGRERREGKKEGKRESPHVIQQVAMATYPRIMTLTSLIFKRLLM